MEFFLYLPTIIRSQFEPLQLSGAHIRSKRPSKKLVTKRYGPFHVTEKLGRNAYRLELPPSYGIHPVFHVSLLEPFHIREGEESERPPPVLLNNVGEFEVERLLDDKLYRKNRKYLVRWKAYPPDEDIWEPERSLAEHAHEAVEEYWREESKDVPDSFWKAREDFLKEEAEEAAENDKARYATFYERAQAEEFVVRQCWTLGG